MRIIHNSFIQNLRGAARFLFLRMIFIRALRANGLSLVGSDISFFIFKGGSVDLGNHISLGKSVEIQARGGSIIIGSGTTVNSYSRAVAFKGISIGCNCAIGQFVAILDHDHAYNKDGRMLGYVTKKIEIGNDVWIGDKATILKGVTIGDGARIGAGAVVNCDVPEGCLAVGVPCRVIRAYNQAAPTL